MTRLPYEWFVVLLLGWPVATCLATKLWLDVQRRRKERARVEADPAAMWLEERSGWISEWIIREDPPLERIATEFAKMCKDHAGLIVLRDGNTELIQHLTSDESGDPGDDDPSSAE